jgi:hypothetical protein
MKGKLNEKGTEFIEHQLVTNVGEKISRFYLRHYFVDQDGIIWFYDSMIKDKEMLTLNGAMNDWKQYRILRSIASYSTFPYLNPNFQPTMIHHGGELQGHTMLDFKHHMKVNDWIT